MAEIKSPNVVALKDATKTISNFYLVMELCNGGDMQTLCKTRGGYLPEQEARFVLKQLVQGLAAIKSKNVIHRDLKLPNILIHFPELPSDIVNDPDFNMSEYLKECQFVG